MVQKAVLKRPVHCEARHANIKLKTDPGQQKAAARAAVSIGFRANLSSPRLSVGGFRISKYPAKICFGGAGLLDKMSVGSCVS